MLDSIRGIKWVGSLSNEDADILASYGKKAYNVLEAGAGGSTMIFAQTAQRVVSIEDNPRWKDATKRRLDILGCTNVSFYTTETFNSGEMFDLIFIDGKNTTRYSDASRLWQNLCPDGIIIFHDTTRRHYLKQAMSFHLDHLYEIEEFYINPVAKNNVMSNLTIFRRGIYRPMLTWTKGRPRWSLGDLDTFDKFYEVE